MVEPGMPGPQGLNGTKGEKGELGEKGNQGMLDRKRNSTERRARSKRRPTISFL